MSALHYPSLTGRPLCGEAERWRRKGPRAHAMASADGVTTCRLCIRVLGGYGEAERIESNVRRARRILDEWAARRTAA